MAERVPLLLIFGACAASAFAQPAREVIAQGNDAARTGDWARAAEAYQSAATLDEGALAAEAAYNRARALQGRGDTQAAVEAYREAATLASGKPELAARSMFNLAGIAVEEAEAAAMDNPGSAISAYRDAAGLFREAYRLNPGDAEAARNLEAVHQRIADLREQIRKQQEMQEKLQQLADDLQQLNVQQQDQDQPQEQRSEGEQSTQGEGQKQEGAEEPPSQPQQQQQREGRQQDSVSEQAQQAAQ
ncbi:MAG: hypothetical protein ACTS27_10920, partial [Phycisphaerales bacterium]